MKIFYIIFVWELYFFIELIDFSRKKLTLYKIIYSSLKQTDVSFHISCVVAKIYSLVLAYPFGLWHLISLLSSCCHRHKVFDFRLFFWKIFSRFEPFLCYCIIIIIKWLLLIANIRLVVNIDGLTDYGLIDCHIFVIQRAND